MFDICRGNISKITQLQILERYQSHHSDKKYSHEINILTKKMFLIKRKYHTMIDFKPK